MQSLLARLGNTTNDDVVHSFARHAGPRDDRVEDLCAEIDRVPAGKAATATSTGGTDGGYDICFCHFTCS